MVYSLYFTTYGQHVISVYDLLLNYNLFSSQQSVHYNLLYNLYSVVCTRLYTQDLYSVVYWIVYTL